MDVLTELLSSRVKAEIFRLLFGVGDAELHVREIERRSGLADATVRQELRRLTGLGIVVRRADGNRTYYRANTTHPLYPDLRNLVLKTSGLVDVLRDALTHPGIRLAFVFGSLTHSTRKSSGDLDLMVIGAISLRQVGNLLSGVGARLGCEIKPQVLSSEEFIHRRKSREHVITSVLSETRLFVMGTEDDLRAMSA